MPKPSRNRHRQNQALRQHPELQKGQTVARVIQACGENNYQVELEDGSTTLFHLPKRLRYVAFVKRGSFVFVREDGTRGEGRVRGDIETVVLDTFVPALRKESYWPARFAQQGQREGKDTARGEEMSSAEVKGGVTTAEQFAVQDGLVGQYDSDDDDDDWQIGMGNPNRGKWDHVPDDSDDDDDDDGDDDENGDINDREERNAN